MQKLRVLFPAVLLGLLVCGFVFVAQSQGPDGVPNDDRVRFDGDKVVRVTIRDQADLDIMDAISPDPWSHTVGIGEVDYRVPADNLDDLEASGIPYEILIEDVQYLVDRSFERGDASGGFFADYKTRDQLNTFYSGLASSRPDLVQISVIGQSIEGRDIHVVKITGNNGGTKPQVCYQFLQHAREWISVMSGAYLAEALVNGYGNDDYITALMDRIEFHIVPIANPDGYVYSWGPDRLWRKNRRNNGGGIFGVDMNRNWDADWGGVGASPNPSDPTYHGTAPFSEPETFAVSEYIKTLPRHRGMIDIHCYSQLVLWPWGYTPAVNPHADEFDELGTEVAQDMGSLYGKQFIQGPVYETIYPASGGAEDWAYDYSLTVNPDEPSWALTFELRDTGEYGFLLPPSQIVAGAEESLIGSLSHAEWVASGLRFEFPNGLPTYVSPDNGATFDVRIAEQTGTAYQGGTAELRWRLMGGGGFQSAPLVSQGGDLFEATLPAAACGSTIEFYFEADATDGSTHTAPFTAPNAFETAGVADLTTVLADNFQTNTGWTVQNISLADGAWQRGVPANGERGDPPADFDGSGSCYVTDNVAGNSDVDGGPTILTSPILDLSSGTDAYIDYAYWMYCSTGVDDVTEVEISNNGGSTWVNARTYTGSGGWSPDSIRVADYVAPTSTVRIRFSVADQPNDSIVEAGLDAFHAYTIECVPSGAITLTHDPLVRGMPATFTVTGAEPSTTVYFFYTKRGTGAGPCDPFFGGLCFDLLPPVKQFTTAVADQNGVATRTRNVPANAPIRTFHLQAVNRRGTDGDASVKSNVSETVPQ